MRLGIIADTHMPKKGKDLPKELLAGITDVDLIIHAGDWTSMDTVKRLAGMAPIVGVHGNNDEEEVMAHFPDKLLMTKGGVRIGVVHGHMGKGRSTKDRAKAAFQEEVVDVIIFGHSHIPYLQKEDGILLFNPGSPTDKRRQPSYSYGIMEINEEKDISFSHHYYAEN